jgi:serine/threonine-protein kinase
VRLLPSYWGDGFGGEGFAYLSPEAARGVADVDRRTDVFSIGTILWELLAGRVLFKGDTDYQTVELVRGAIIPSLIAFNDEVDRDLDAIVRKALANERFARYDSIDELGEALLQYLSARGIVMTSYDLRAVLGDE